MTLNLTSKVMKHRPGQFYHSIFRLLVEVIVILSDLVKFIMFTLISRVHMTFYILKKGYIVPGNQGTFDKLNQICILSFCSIFSSYCDTFHLKRDKYTVYRDISNSAGHSGHTRTFFPAHHYHHLPPLHFCLRECAADKNLSK